MDLWHYSFLCLSHTRIHCRRGDRRILSDRGPGNIFCCEITARNAKEAMPSFIWPSLKPDSTQRAQIGLWRCHLGLALIMSPIALQVG